MNNIHRMMHVCGSRFYKEEYSARRCKQRETQGQLYIWFPFLLSLGLFFVCTDVLALVQNVSQVKSVKTCGSLSARGLQGYFKLDRCTQKMKRMFYNFINTLFP